MVTVDRVAAQRARARTDTENSTLIEIPHRHIVDRLLLTVPDRPKTLATPPSGRQSRAVRGDAGLPYIGRTLHYMRWGPAVMLDRYRRFGPVTLNSSLGMDRVFAAGPDALDEVLGRRRRDFGQGWDYFIGPFFRRGLLLLEFDEHMFHRRIMQQAFTRERLEAHLAELTPVVRSTIGRWVPAGRDAQQTVQLFPAIKEMALDIAGETFMAVEVGDERAKLTEAFVACTHAGLAMVRHSVPGGKWRAGLRGRKVLEDYFRAMLPQKRRSDAPDFFSGLCHA
ncbi:MAG: cytochrome P450, partial [Stackebrandtia sp.]